MLRPHADSDHTRRYPPQNRKPLQQFDREGELPVAISGRATGHYPVMNEDLRALNDGCGPFAPLLDSLEISHGNSAVLEFLAEQIGRRNRILQREINADAARR